MGLQHPELLLFLLPAGWVWWRMRAREPITDGVRALVLLLLALALAAPYLERGDDGRDLVVVVDRSRSMPEGAAEQALELVLLAEAERGEDDRVGVVAFGARATVERPLSATLDFPGFEREVDVDGSDLAQALETALELVPEGRRASILVISDGEAKGRDPLSVARRAFARGVRVDVRATPRPGRIDLAVERVETPERAESGEPFQFSAWVRTDARVEAEFLLERDGEALTRGRRVFEVGLNRLVFRDRVDRPGLAEYRLRVLGAEDRSPENDSGLAAVSVTAGRRLLVVNEDGAPDALVLALRAAGLTTDVRAPELAPLDRNGLEGYRAVVLENVAAGRIPADLDDLRRFVLERGGGLLVTGGKASFGVGGYYLSPIDEVLPVSMEMRQEQRKQGMALAIAMDRSGSMSAPTGDGRTKMDLANLGASAAIELLSAIDAVAVIAVDSAAHVVQELESTADIAPILARVRSIESMGGGIFTHTALEAAVRELQDAEQVTRHIILFADAADSEEQEGCIELAEELVQAGVTLSVIALGTEQESDAGFLQDLALAGDGEAYFTTSAEDLPRLFAQDTLTVSRTTFVEEPTEVQALSDLFGLGELATRAFPTLAGYNLTWLRPGGVAGAVTLDEFHAPVFAFAHRGLGRAAAFTGQVGGSFGQEVLAWSEFDDFFVTVGRWLMGNDEPEALFASVRREGREAVVEVELDPGAPLPPDTAGLTAALGLADGSVLELPMERVARERFQARFPLEREGIALPTVHAGVDVVQRLPPVALPYSPEFEPTADRGGGERRLRELALESGGMAEPPTSDLFRGERGGTAWRGIARELALAALILLLIEIAGRRLALFEAVRARITRRPVREEPVPISAATKPSRAKAPPARERPAPTPIRPEPTQGARPSLADALARARDSAKRELDR